MNEDKFFSDQAHGETRAAILNGNGFKAFSLALEHSIHWTKKQCFLVIGDLQSAMRVVPKKTECFTYMNRTREHLKKEVSRKKKLELALAIEGMVNV